MLLFSKYDLNLSNERISCVLAWVSSVNWFLAGISFATLKGKKVIFKVVNSFPDIKVQFVDNFGDYKVKILNSKSSIKETIKIQIVNSFPDVKFQKTNSHTDFEAFIE